LGKALPAFAERLCAPPSHETERVPVSSLAPGDWLRVKAGEAFPADGIVVEGSSSADESLLTGESRPVAKAVGCEVAGGSINRSSPLLIRVSQVGERTRLAAICDLMERAQAEKPRVVVLADRVAGWFVAVLLVLAAATACVWIVIDPTRALWVFVSVLVVSCPCALSLATPAALTAATGALSRLGLLVTRGHAIEALAGVTHFVFDKTGTLTHGRLQLTGTITLGELDKAAALELAAALERSSEHAIGAGLRAAAGAAPLASIAAEQVVTGQGVEAQVGGVRHRIGRIEFVVDLAGRLPPSVQPIEAADLETLVGLGSEHGWIALFRLRDELRSEAPALIERLHRSGLHVCILSGDAIGAVADVASKLGVSNAQGALTPQGKHDFIVGLQRQGAVVAMVGDGVNDAPVLAQAQVSIAMGGGTDLARTQGDLVLLSEDLGRLAEGFFLARRTSSIIRQNLVWAFFYNVLAIPAAMLGWVAPWMAGIGMSASSLLVVLNALRLSKRRTPDGVRAAHRASMG
jgi:Cu2+-exporting ATPase